MKPAPENVHSTSPQRRGYVPTDEDRHRVVIGAAGGMTAVAMAAALGVNRRTFNRVFAVELKTGRTKLTLEMGLVLFNAATVDRNVAAAKALLSYATNASAPDTRAPDDDVRWNAILERYRKKQPISEILAN